jgi:predicted transcriptional regulator
VKSASVRRSGMTAVSYSGRIDGNRARENIAMLVSIEFPERVLEPVKDALESRARKQHSSVQAIAVEALENDLARVASESAALDEGLSCP